MKSVYFARVRSINTPDNWVVYMYPIMKRTQIGCLGKIHNIPHCSNAQDKSLRGSKFRCDTVL